MPIRFNHTIVAAHDRQVAANFLTELFGLPAPKPFGPFLAVALDDGASLDYIEVPADEEIRAQHYAFLVSEQDFDDIYGRITSWRLEHWGDPHGRHPGEINHNDGGRGVYFNDPAGHFLEIITRPYGSGG